MKTTNALSNIPMGEVVAIARDAGAAIMQTLSTDVQMDIKTDASPITNADKRADFLIKQRLRALTPTIPIISEEDTPTERNAAATATLRWVVDPLDGTRTAIRYANGQIECNQFGVHIGLVRGDTPIAGVAFFPAMSGGAGIAYYTGDDGNAYKQAGDGPPTRINVSKPPLKPTGLRAAVSFKGDRQPATIAGKKYVAVPGVGGQRLCLVAEGAADIADMDDIPLNLRSVHAYKQWDLAAAHAILKAAGGELVSIHSQQPTLYDNAAYTMPPSYAGGKEMLNLLHLATLPIQGKGR